MERIQRTVQKKILMTQITTMVWSVTQTQWSHPNLVEVIKFQQSFKMMLSKCCTQHVSKFGKPSSGHRTGKGQSSSQFPRRVELKNVLPTGQLRSSPTLVTSCLKSWMLGFSIMGTKHFQMSKLGLGKEEEPEIKLPTFAGSQRKQGNSRKTFISVTLTILKSLTVWIITNYGKLLKIWGYQTILPVSQETCMQVKKQVRTLYRTTDWLRLRKYDRAVCPHYDLIYMLRTSWEMLDWISYKLELR